MQCISFRVGDSSDSWGCFFVTGGREEEVLPVGMSLTLLAALSCFQGVLCGNAGQLFVSLFREYNLWLEVHSAYAGVEFQASLATFTSQ